MIKDVLNSIRSEANSGNVPIVGVNLSSKAGDDQSFFGRIFKALQQEEKDSSPDEVQSEVAKPDEAESREGREAVKHALINLMNGEETTHTEKAVAHLGESEEEVNSGLSDSNSEKNSAVRLMVQNAETEKEMVSEDIKISSIHTELNTKTEETAANKAIQRIGNSELPKNAVTQGETNVEKTNVVTTTAQETASQLNEVSVKTGSDTKLDRMVQPNEEAKGDRINKVENLFEDIGSNMKAEKSTQLNNLKSEVITSASKNPNIEQNKAASFVADPTSVKEVVGQNERSAQAFQQMSQKQVSESEVKAQLHLQNEIKSQQAKEERAKRYDYISQNANEKSLNGERLEVATTNGSSGGNQQGASFTDTPNWLKFQSIHKQKAGGELNNQQQAFFDEHLSEVTEKPGELSTEKSQSGLNRLGDVPIHNALIRRNVLPGLTSIMQRATSSGKEISQNWQKHSFELDDGNKIELSTRNSDGVIELKIASSNHELAKLLQQYGQEIKEHLEKECELNIDLQFSDEQKDGLTGFFGENSLPGNGKSAGITEGNRASGESHKANEPLQQSVRRFGYNQMEWIA